MSKVEPQTMTKLKNCAD